MLQQHFIVVKGEEKLSIFQRGERTGPLQLGTVLSKPPCHKKEFWWRSFIIQSSLRFTFKWRRFVLPPFLTRENITIQKLDDWFKFYAIDRSSLPNGGLIKVFALIQSVIRLISLIECRPAAWGPPFLRSPPKDQTDLALKPRGACRKSIMRINDVRRGLKIHFSLIVVCSVHTTVARLSTQRNEMQWNDSDDRCFWFYRFFFSNHKNETVFPACSLVQRTFRQGSTILSLGWLLNRKIIRDTARAQEILLRFHRCWPPIRQLGEFCKGFPIGNKTPTQYDLWFLAAITSTKASKLYQIIKIVFQLRYHNPVPTKRCLKKVA